MIFFRSCGVGVSKSAGEERLSAGFAIGVCDTMGVQLPNVLLRLGSSGKVCTREQLMASANAQGQKLYF